MNNTCAIYVRLSKDDGLDVSQSIQNQIKNLKEYAIANEFNIYNIYVDDGYSGKNMNRPGFQALLKDIKHKKFSILIVKDISRLGRSLNKVGEFVEEFLPTYKIRLISILDNYDSKSYVNEDSIVLKSFLNDYYLKECRKKAIKMIDRIREKKILAKKGIYGYDLVDGKLIINPEEAKIIKRIFEEYVSLKPPSQIRKDLANDKIYGIGYLRSIKSTYKGQNENPYHWSSVSIARIIKERTYIGEYTNNLHSKYFEHNIILNSNEPIISKEIFEKAQQILKSRVKKQTRSKYAGFVIDKTTNRSASYNASRNVIKLKGKYLDVNVLEEVLKKELDILFFELTKDKEALFNVLNNKNTSIKEEIQKIKFHISTLEDKLKTLFENYILKNISSIEFKNTSARITENINALKNKYNLILLEEKNGVDKEKYDILVEEFLAKKKEVNDIILLSRMIYKHVYILYSDGKCSFEFEYNI